jgi:hypothetical protein
MIILLQSLVTPSRISESIDVLSAGIGPWETHPELIVDPDAVLSLPIAFERFQTISRLFNDLSFSYSRQL